MRRHFWLSSLAILAAPAAFSQTFVIQHDNDEWGGNGTDWEYSQGTRLTWLSPKLAESGLAKSAASILPGIDPNAHLEAGLAAGASFYEPRFLALTTPITTQRPYAGWLYASALLNADTDASLTTWRIDLGVVGPAAQGEEFTEFFHNVFSGYDQNGWDNQIENRLGLNVIAERRWRNIVPIAGDIAFDISPAIGAEFGTVSLAANANLMLRIGTGLANDFGPPRVGAFSGSLSSRPSAFSLYAFASATGSYVPYDVFLDEQGGSDGDPVRAGSATTRDDTRTQTSYGLVIASGPLRGALAFTDASKTYDQQLAAERFSEMSLAIRF